MMINKKLMNKRYSNLSRVELINLLISSREEVYELRENDNQYKVFQLNNVIKKAIKYIDTYTCNRKYITDNDKELLNILEKGRKYD